ncbi:MAG: activator of ATPase 1 family protein [Microbacteriaceae bacterium]|jgi:uncharacterized protein YndB with AHSA1/START domain|nr:activator of ATPase 1 family protein [Microbacteriaceae bacterium]
MTTTKNQTTITAQPGTPFIDMVREFDATPQVVYRASTDPELIPKWMGPRGLDTRIDAYDLRPGGNYRYVQTDADGNEFAFRGIFHTVEPGLRTIQTFEFEGMPGFVTLEYGTYEDLGGRTRFTGHSVYPSVEARDGALQMDMESGMRESMERLEELLPGLG